MRRLRAWKKVYYVDPKQDVRVGELGMGREGGTALQKLGS